LRPLKSSRKSTQSLACWQHKFELHGTFQYDLWGPLLVVSYCGTGYVLLRLRLNTYLTPSIHIDS
jgi:hypothetical protein